MSEPLAPKPLAWARRWHANGETPAKERNDKGRLVWPLRFKLLAVTPHQCCRDDVPPYAPSSIT